MTDQRLRLAEHGMYRPEFESDACGVGLVAAKAVSAWLIWEARRLGVPKGTLLRMVGNVGLDALISVVPVAGWVGDVFWRANLRNVALLRGHLERGDRPRR